MERDAPWLVGRPREHIIARSIFLRTFSAAAIAANLALGHSTGDAIREGCTFISEALKSTDAALTSFLPIGKGENPPMNHLYRIKRLLDAPALTFPPGSFIDWLLRHPKVRDIWQQYTHHEFVNKMGDGTLDVERFKFYLEQDYLFLIQFARANSLAGYKSGKLDDICKVCRKNLIEV